MPKNKEISAYTASFWVKVLVGTELDASSMEDALQKARQIKQENLVKVLGEYMDDDGFTLNSIWKNQ